MPTNRYYIKQSNVLANALPDIVRFLINDHLTITGPGWTIVEARSNTAREVPSDPSDLDSLVTATDWKNDSIAVGDWIVLESTDSLSTNHFQLFMEYQSTTALNLRVIPLEDFATGGGDASPPTFPSTSFGNNSTTVSMTVPVHNSGYTVVADEGSMIIVVDGHDTAITFAQLGELDGVPFDRDPRPYYIHYVPGQVGHAAGNVFSRLSPIDNTTLINGGVSAVMGVEFDHMHEDIEGRIFSSHYFLPASVFFRTASHQHFAGWQRNMYAGKDTGDNNGIRISPQGRFLMVSDATTITQLAIKWNGETY